MRIPCCYCGERGNEEFAYLGDATVVRPEGDAGEREWTDYVYLRDNPAGEHHELWHHVAGCRAWLVVTRNLRTLNGQTTARDLGLGRMMSSRKDFIGRAMARRPGLTDPERPALVGIKPVDRNARLHAGAHLIPENAEPVARNDQGHVTSVAFSPVLGHWIGLGLLARGPARHGERVRAYDPVRAGDTPVEVCDPVFLDPKGERLRG